MLVCAKQLERKKHVCVLPKDVHDYAKRRHMRNPDKEEDAIRKIAYDLIREHCKIIATSDAIFVVNCKKDGIHGYIGGNTLIEIGYAHVEYKKIFLLNEIPDLPLIKQEILAVRPVIIHNNFNLVKE